MTAPTAPSPGLGEREAVARGINPVAFACGPELYGLSADDHEWRLSFGYGAQQVALRRADAIIAEHIEPLRTENETLRAEREQSEKHRNDLMDSIVSLKTERGALRSRLAAVEAERDAAIARAEEAGRGLRTILYFSKEDPDLQPRYAVAAALKNVHLTARAALTNPEHPHGD